MTHIGTVFLQTHIKEGSVGKVNTGAPSILGSPKGIDPVPVLVIIPLPTDSLKLNVLSQHPNLF